MLVVQMLWLNMQNITKQNLSLYTQERWSGVSGGYQEWYTEYLELQGKLEWHPQMQIRWEK
jgi:hypothetical protein